jgi:hypothetical protein
MKHAPFIVAACVAFLLARPASADTGQLREVVMENGMHVLVFTSPTPLRAGVVEVAVLATDAGNGAPLDAFELEVEVREPEWDAEMPSMVFDGGLDRSDRFVRKAILDLPEAGAWEMVVSVRREGDSVRVPLSVTVGQALPDWWQVLPVALLGVPFAVLVVVRDRLKNATLVS